MRGCRSDPAQVETRCGGLMLYVSGSDTIGVDRLRHQQWTISCQTIDTERSAVQETRSDLQTLLLPTSCRST